MSLAVTVVSTVEPRPRASLAFVSILRRKSPVPSATAPLKTAPWVEFTVRLSLAALVTAARLTPLSAVVV